MIDGSPAAPAWPLPVLASVAGPTVAFLHESGTLDLGGSGSLAPIAAVVLVATVGVGVGVRALRRGPRWAGGLACVTNGAVVALYGFLLLFFGLGGSR